MYACQTIYKNDFSSQGYSRYNNIFHGLHLILGAWGSFWDGWTTEECGEDFADNLIDGWSLRSAWFDGTSDWWCDQEAAVLSAERSDTYNGGDPIWSQTTMYSDHYHGKGTVKADISHENLYWIGLSWVEG
jgi:hypothetical protein